MSYTNNTTNLQLPQWLASDKPNWDIDLNNAFQRIDNFAGEKNTGDASLSNRINENQEAITSLQGEVTTLEGVQTTQGERITDLESTSTSHASSITKLNNDVDALDGKTTSLETRMGTAETDIDALQSQVGLNTGNITALQGRKEVKTGQITYSREQVSSKITNTITIQIEEEDYLKPAIAIIPLIILQPSSPANMSLYVDLGVKEFFESITMTKMLFQRFDTDGNNTSLFSAHVNCDRTSIDGNKVLRIRFDMPASLVNVPAISQSQIPTHAIYIPLN